MNFKLGVETGMTTDAMAEKMKLIMTYGIPIGILVGSSYFPSVIIF